MVGAGWNMPVSYTHLDVYKRQPLSRRLTLSAILASTSLTEGTVKLALSTWETVSYTHLDVYKRQTPTCCATGRSSSAPFWTTRSSWGPAAWLSLIHI